MPQTVLIKRTSTINSPPTGLQPGELAVEMNEPTRLWVGVPTSIDASGKKQLTPSGGVIVSDTAPTTPKQGDLWFESDTMILWMWYVDPNSSQWLQVNGGGGGGGVTVADVPPGGAAQGDLFWESDTGILWIWYDDGNSAQWVQAAGSGGGATGDFVKKTGDTMSGALTISTTAAGGSLKLSDTTNTDLSFAFGGLTTWGVRGGDGGGSDFSIFSYDDTGAWKGTPLTIDRATGNTAMTGALTINNNGANTGHTYYGTSGTKFVGYDGTNMQINGSTQIWGGVNVQGTTYSSGNITCAGDIHLSGNVSPSTVYYNNSGTAVGSVWWDGVQSFMTFQYSTAGTALYLSWNGDFNYSGGTGTAWKNGGGAWAAFSDARIKNVVQNYQHGLDEILQLNPVTYTYKGNDTTTVDGQSTHKMVADSGTVFVGLVAQDVENIFTGMVKQTTGFIDGVEVNDLRGLDPSELTYALINAVKELSAANDALSARIAALEGAR